jgi:hypothetical protein
METRVQNILSQTGTKTAKIRQLILMGLTRRQIANLVTNGNYGFVQNVYAKMRQEGLLSSIDTPLQHCFNRKFGVEFEAYNVKMSVLNNALNDAGIRCEIEGYNHNTSNHWKIVTDGSLSGNNTFELVSPILTGEVGIQELQTVCRVLEECGAKVNKSCGTHVHLDAAGFSLDQWKRIYINYSRLERTIDGFMPHSRRANNNSYTKSLLSISNLERKINACRSTEDIRRVFDNSRYFKINPLSYSRHKTCEFRQHSGTIDFEKIKNWIKFADNLVEYSKENTVQNTELQSLQFCPPQMINYYTQRTLQLAA